MPDLNDFFNYKNSSEGADSARGGTGGCFPVILLLGIAAAIHPDSFVCFVSGDTEFHKGLIQGRTYKYP